MNTVETASAVMFWVCAALVCYAYLVYPLLIWGLARWFGRQGEIPASDGELPTVSLLIAAHNEEAEIEKRIQTALLMDYPADRLDIVVASDGSSDGTAEIVRRYAGRGIRLLDYSERQGKAAVLNSAFAELSGEIVLLSDANTQTDPAALRKIVRWFRQPAVGVVCGRLVLTDPRTGRNVDSLYWRYETFLKRCEGRLGALLGSNGAIYAIRRALFAPVPSGTIADDLVIPLQARLRTGCKIIYEYEAVAWEETPPDIRSEFRRRSRIGAGGFQSIGMLCGLLHPRQGWVAFTFLSHKICRWFCPFFLFGALLSNLVLWDWPLYLPCLVGQLGFYSGSLVAGFLPPRLQSLKALRLTTMFTGMNAALLVGFCRWVWGNQTGSWERTVRLPETEGVH